MSKTERVVGQLCLCLAVVLGGLGLSARALAAHPTVRQCLSATESALQLRNAGKLRGARRELLVCAAASCPSDVRADCTRAVDEINAQIPSVIFRATGVSGADITAVAVTMDGELLVAQIDGTAVSVDPGTHEFAFRTPSGDVVTKTLTLRQAERDRHETVRFVLPTPVVVVPVQPVVVTPAPRPLRHTGLDTPRVAGIVLGAIGVTGAALGSAFGILTAEAIAAQKRDCSSAICTSQGYQAAQTKHTMWTTDSTISTVSFVAAGVLLATGATLLFTAHPHPPSASARLTVAPSLGAAGGAVLLRGEF